MTTPRGSIIEDSDKKAKGEGVAAFAWTLSPLVLSLSVDYCPGLPDQVDSFLQDRVGRRDDSRVGLIAALRDQHVDELVSNVHV